MNTSSLTTAAFTMVLATSTFLNLHAQPAGTTTSSGFSVTAAEEDDGVTVRVNGELFTRYVVGSVARPVLWPVIGPTGKPMTRSYPLGEAQLGEAKDHVHHQSIWLGYEGVNEVDNWVVPESGHHSNETGTVAHREFVKVGNENGTALIVARNDWLDASGDRVCTDERTLRFGAEDNLRWIDYRVEIMASEGPLRIGDSKEGVFAIRVAGTMKVDAKMGGQFVLSNGLEGEDEAWGQRAEWADYHGPIDGQTLGIAILAHPKSFQPRPRWHVREYGLFSANSFGELAFTEENPPPVRRRPIVATVPEGDSLTLQYRVIFHRGDEKQADIAGHFAKYASE